MIFTLITIEYPISSRIEMQKKTGEKPKKGKYGEWEDR